MRETVAAARGGREEVDDGRAAALVRWRRGQDPAAIAQIWPGSGWPAMARRTSSCRIERGGRGNTGDLDALTSSDLAEVEAALASGGGGREPVEDDGREDEDDRTWRRRWQPRVKKRPTSEERAATGSTERGADVEGEGAGDGEEEAHGGGSHGPWRIRREEEVAHGVEEGSRHGEWSHHGASRIRGAGMRGGASGGGRGGDWLGWLWRKGEEPRRDVKRRRRGRAEGRRVEGYGVRSGFEGGSGLLT